MTFELTFLTGLFVYFGLLAAAAYLGYRWARRRNLSMARVRLAALAGFLIVFLPVAWDTVPTLVTYEWYCRKEAGFHNYKTIDQWKRENPGAIEAIQAAQARQGGASPPRAGAGMQYEINSRFRRETRSETRAWGIKTRDERLVDSKTQEVIARFLDFGTDVSGFGPRGIRSFRDLKFWMRRTYCVADRDASGLNDFAAVVNQVSAMGATR